MGSGTISKNSAAPKTGVTRAVPYTRNMTPLRTSPPKMVIMRGRVPPHKLINTAPLKAPRLISPTTQPISCSEPVTAIR